ncbi:hypothetical protein EVAR_79742_1 [Eumeta japonica]|uniref:Mariner Mos1 transposase n=1 Tax=Eumeta variegata TaxID=151549 RepID=A0A4C1T9F6_EUMVA|nr:hypothetical protein EVAR_79742_1 [Eumeta japonica]
MIAFFVQDGPIRTIPLEEQKTVNAEWFDDTFTGLEETVVAFNQHVQTMPSDQWSAYFQKRSILLTVAETQAKNKENKPELVNRKGVVFHYDDLKPHTPLATQELLSLVGKC